MQTKEDYYWYKEHHICTRCHKYKAMQNKTMCSVCLEKDAERSKKYRARMSEEKREKAYLKIGECKKIQHDKRLESEICTTCGKRKANDGFKTCIECRTKDAQKRARNSKEYRKTSGTCAYCDEPPIPGKRCCPKHYASRVVGITKCRQSEGFRLSQIEQKKRMSVFWREMEWERNQRMKQPQWICPQPR